LPADLMSSIADSPIGSSAASVFWISTVSRTFTSRPRTSRKRAIAPSISLTAMATWSIFLMRIILPLISWSVPRSKRRRYIMMPGDALGFASSGFGFVCLGGVLFRVARSGADHHGRAPAADAGRARARPGRRREDPVDDRPAGAGEGSH